MEVDALLEMVASAIWNDSMVDDVKLSDAPSIKSRLRKQLFEHPVIAYLDIPAPHAQSSHVAGTGQSAGITMVKHPADACGLAVNSLDIQELDISKGIEYSHTNLHSFAMRPTDRCASFANYNMEVTEAHVRSNVPQSTALLRKLPQCLFVTTFHSGIRS